MVGHVLVLSLRSSPMRAVSAMRRRRKKKEGRKKASVGDKLIMEEARAPSKVSGRHEVDYYVRRINIKAHIPEVNVEGKSHLLEINNPTCNFPEWVVGDLGYLS